MKNLKVIFASLTFLFLFISFSNAQSNNKARNTRSANLPDLIVTNVKLIPVSPSQRRYSGKTIKVPVEITVKNIGRKSVRSSFDILIQSQVNNTFASTPRGLRVGQSIKIKTSIKLPARFMNTSMRLTATADMDRTTDDVYSGSIRESNERNNTKGTYLRIPRYYKAGNNTAPAGQVVKR